MARERGRFSPDLAEAMAAHLGEDVARWRAIAIAEQLPPRDRQYLLSKIAATLVVGALGISAITPLPGHAAERICIM
jgi:hypothetical protein